MVVSINHIVFSLSILSCGFFLLVEKVRIIRFVLVLVVLVIVIVVVIVVVCRCNSNCNSIRIWI